MSLHCLLHLLSTHPVMTYFTCLEVNLMTCKDQSPDIVLVREVSVLGLRNEDCEGDPLLKPEKEKHARSFSKSKVNKKALYATICYTSVTEAS